MVAVSTGDVSPALAKLIREKMEEDFPDSFDEWLEILLKVRKELKETVADGKAREHFWRMALNNHILELVKQGKLQQAEAELKNAALDFGA